MSTSGGGSLMDMFVEIRAEHPKLAADLEAAQAKILRSGEETQAKLRAMMLRQQLEMKSMGNPGTAQYDNQTAGQRAHYESLAAGAAYIAEEMKKAQEVTDRKTASIQKYVDKVATATTSVKAFGQAEAATAAVQSKADAQAARRGGGLAANEELQAVRQRTYGFMLLTQAAEDMQYGFNAVVNNIPGIAMAFGVGAGLAGGLSLAGVAVNQLINNWSLLMDKFGLGGTLAEADAMNKLAEATSRTAEEQLKLNKYREREATEAAQTAGKTDMEKAQADIVNEAIRTSGVDKVREGLRAAGTDVIAKDLDASAAQEAVAKREADIRRRYAWDQLSSGRRAKPGDGDTVERRVYEDEDLRAKKVAYEDSLKKATNKYLAEAALDPLKLDLLIKQVAKNPGAFPEGFGAKLAFARPEEIEMAKELAAERKAAEDSIKSDRETARGYDEIAKKKILDDKKKILDDEKKADDKRAKSDRRIEQAKIEKDFDDDVIGDISKAAGPMAYGISTGFSERITRNLANDLLKTGKESNPESARKTAEKVVADAADKLTEAAKEMVLSGKARTVAEAEKTIGLEEMVAEAEKRKSEAAKLIDDFKPKISDIGSYLNSLQTNVGGDPRLIVAEKALRKAEDALKEHKATNEKLATIAMKETGMWR